MAKIDLRNPDNWIPRELYQAYVGDRSQKLLAHYDKAKSKRSPLVMSFNLFAILALPAWLGFRQQWTLWATFVGLFSLLPFVEHLAGFEIPAGAFVGIGLAMGMMAHGLLLLNANTLYWKLRKRDLDGPELAKALASRAQTSVSLAFAGGIGALAILLGINLLAEALFG